MLPGMRLARVLGVPESSLRLGWMKAAGIVLRRPVDVTIDNRAGRLQEAVFLRGLLFARQWEDYWCVAEDPATFLGS